MRERGVVLQHGHPEKRSFGRQGKHLPAKEYHLCSFFHTVRAGGIGLWVWLSPSESTCDGACPECGAAEAVLCFLLLSLNKKLVVQTRKSEKLSSEHPHSVDLTVASYSLQLRTETSGVRPAFVSLLRAQTEL
jgi:hypothetical protein